MRVYYLKLAKMPVLTNKKTMTISEIKTAVDAGYTVQWASPVYRVIKDKIGQYLIICSLNDYCIGLTNLDGTRLNGQESEFQIV